MLAEAYINLFKRGILHAWFTADMVMVVTAMEDMVPVIVIVQHSF
ncbi:hypothetical protein [Neobacillus vireti]